MNRKTNFTSEFFQQRTSPLRLWPKTKSAPTQMLYRTEVKGQAAHKNFAGLLAEFFVKANQ